MSMLGNSYHTGGGPLSQNHVQSVNNMMLSDHSNDSSLFDINNDFPQLTSRPGSAGGTQGQLGSQFILRSFEIHILNLKVVFGKIFPYLFSLVLLWWSF